MPDMTDHFRRGANETTPVEPGEPRCPSPAPCSSVAAYAGGTR